MKKSILIPVLATVLVTPAMADISQGEGARLPLSESAAYGVPVSSQYDWDKCEAHAAGKEGVHPFECIVGSRSIGSEGGSDTDSATD